MFVRFVGLRHFHGFDVPEHLSRVRAWRDTLVSDPIVMATSPEEAPLLAAYEAYLTVLSHAAAAGVDVPVAKGD